MASNAASSSQDSGDSSHKGDVSQWIKDGLDLVSLIERGEIRDAEGVKQYLDCSGDSNCLETANSFGQTPLMVACLNGWKEIVSFLLEAGVDLNRTCTDHGNSALHYAFYDLYPKVKLQEIIEIVEVLLRHGATWQMNRDGFSPVCVAAWYCFEDMVAYFAPSNLLTISVAEKVKAYELMGVAQAVFDKGSGIASCESFHTAASFLPEHGNPDIPHHVSSEMDSWFRDMINKRKASESEELEIKMKAFIIGFKCLPHSIKEKYNFWDGVATFVDCALTDCENTETCYDFLVELINEEMVSIILFGTVFRIMYENGQPLSSWAKVMQKSFPKLLEAYADAFQVCQSYSEGHLYEIIGCLGHLLFDLAYFRSQSSYLLQCLPFVGRILESIKKWLAEDTSPDKSQEKESVTLVFFEAMADAMWEDVYSWQSKKTRNRLEFVIHRLLHYNGFDPETESSILQTTLDVLPVARDPEFVYSICLILIRYGCPSCDASIELNDEDDMKLDALLRHIKPVTLQEVASRVILRNKLPYREVLPAVICEKIEGWPCMPDPIDLDSSSESDSD